MRACMLAAAAVIGCGTGAQAAVTTYAVQGVFDDGEALSGSFVLDTSLALPATIAGSTLTIGTLGRYPAFVGASASQSSGGPWPMHIQFFGQGILDLQVQASFDLGLGRITSIASGALLPSALYANVPNDLFLRSGTIAAVATPEPLSLTLVGTGVGLAGALRRFGPRPRRSRAEPGDASDRAD